MLYTYQNKIYLIFLWGVLLLASGISCFAQQVNMPMHFDHLTFQEGLSHNTVFCLLQDRHGYIWVGTKNGLNKYDGYSFKVFKSNDTDKEDSKGFLGRNVYALLEDSKGNLWAGTRKKGINFRPNDSDQFINLQNDTSFAVIKDYKISSLFEDNKQNIWVSTNGGGLLKYNLESKKSQHFTTKNSALSSDFVFDITQDTFGTIWIGVSENGINYINEKNQFEQLHINSPDMPDLIGFEKTFLVDDHHLWIGTEGTGLYRMDIRKQSFVHFKLGNGPKNITSNVIRDLYKSKDGYIYIATDGGGLNIYDKSTDEIIKYNYSVNKPTSINSNALYCFLEDHTGNIWIGTYNGGININKTSKTFFEHYVPISGGKDELGHQSILSIYQSQDGKIWVGTDGGGLSWFNQKDDRFSFSSLTQNADTQRSISGNVVKSILEDHQKNIWLGVFGMGLSKYNPTAGTFQNFRPEPNNEHSLAGNIVWSIAQRKNGDLWFGTLDGGISIYNPSKQHFRTLKADPENPNTISSNSIMVIFVDKNDRVWIGTEDNGLNLWDDTTENFRNFTNQPESTSSLSSDQIRSIFQDSSGQIWIGTESGGLNRWLGDGRFERITEANGLIANSVMGITEEKDQILWLSTFKGLSRLNTHTKEIKNFDFRDSKNNNQFNQTAILTAKNGTLFFGGIYGLHSIQTSQLKEAKEEAPIIFTDLKVFNKSIYVGTKRNGHKVLEKPIEDAQSISLSYLDHSLAISFAAVDYSSPLENKFSYKMEGFDPVWQSTSKGQNSVSYTNLDYGNYEFKVKYGIQEKSLQIDIHPPFWQTIWFKIGMALLLLGLCYFIVYFINKRNEAIYKQQVLEAKSETLQLKNENLSAEVSTKNSELMYSAVQMAHKNEILTSIKQELKEGKNESNKELRSLIRIIDKQLTTEDYWKEFNLYFNQVDTNFVQNIVASHPSLTQNDIRMCTLIRIQLSTKEISSLLNISVRGVEQSRYRLKKRLNLNNEQDLGFYITSFKRNK